jgi:glycerophosphoryl diester phosphodiesterase
MARESATAKVKRVKLKLTTDRIQTLAELLEQVDGRSSLVIELKSLWDDNDALARRAIEVLEGYDGPCCLMSFDPGLVTCLRGLSPQTVRGIVADRTTDPYYNALPLAKRYAMRTAILPKRCISCLCCDLPLNRSRKSAGWDIRDHLTVRSKGSGASVALL